MDDPNSGSRQWFAVQTKPRQERVAQENLQRQNYSTYCPLITLPKRRKGKWISLIEPLFPRYLFVHLDVARDNFAPIRSTIGVTGLVRFGNELIPVPDQVIHYLIASEEPESGSHQPGQPQFVQGEKVEILEGPFAGLNGIYQIAKGIDRAVILIELLGRQNKVIIPLDDVSKL